LYNNGVPPLGAGRDIAMRVGEEAAKNYLQVDS